MSRLLLAMILQSLVFLDCSSHSARAEQALIVSDSQMVHATYPTSVL